MASSGSLWRNVDQRYLDTDMMLAVASTPAA
jgi:hypothetical protein